MAARGSSFILALALVGCDERSVTVDASADTSATDAPPRLDPNVRRTETGLVRGVERDTAWGFFGIPYAAPPVGDLRFRRPARAEAWSGVRDASAYGAACRQYYYDGTLIGDEDCLTLNVWTPREASAEALPVMVYLHGGDNVYGWSGEGDISDGVRLGEAGVVLVTINYRLGAFGFLADPVFAAENPEGASGNYALHDQIAALAWVQRNIASFGGDPSRVTLFGQSAGASDTCALVASPLAAGLFHRALMQSLNCLVLTSAVVESTWTRARVSLGCTDRVDVAACLRAASADDVAALARDIGADGKYYSSLDGAVLVEDPLRAIAAGRHNAMPSILGTNEDEYTWIVASLLANPSPTEADYEPTLASIFGAELAPQLVALYPLDEFPSTFRAVVEAVSDYIMHCPTRRIARALRQGQTEPTWVYNFARDPTSGPSVVYGAAHSFELPFVFRSFAAWGARPDANDLLLSEAIVAGWTGLARDGAPGGFAWPRFDESEQVTRLDWPLATEPFGHDVRCDTWDSWR